MAHIQKLSKGRWRARYPGVDGKERSQVFARKVDAQKWLTAETSDIAQGRWVDPRLGKMTLEEYLPLWEETLVHLRPRTLELNVGVAHNHLKPRFGRTPLARITSSDVKAMMGDEIGEGVLSTSAIRRHVIVLRLILDAAVADGRIGRNPAAGIKLPAERTRPMRFLEPDQIVILADAIGEHYRPFVLTAAYAGLRWGELAGLAVTNVDLLRRTATVERQLQEIGGQPTFVEPKTRAGVRSVTLPERLVEVLAEHFATEPVQTSGLAFPTVGGRPMRPSNFRKVWRRACTNAGFDGTDLDGLTIHELRHTAAALAIAQGAHPMTIKERLGHASITTTMDRYGHLLPSLDAEVAEGLDAVLRESETARRRHLSADIVDMRRSAG